MALTTEQILSLYAHKRTKGLYEDYLHVLMESDDPGVDPAEEWPMDFGTKSATTMYQGFRNAAEKMGIADQIDVMAREGHVAILVKSRVATLVSEAPEPEVAATNGSSK